MHREVDLPHHGRTFTRVLIDATLEFTGPERADALAASFRTFTACASAAPHASLPTGARTTDGTSGCTSAAAATLTVRWRDDLGRWATESTGTFEGYERGASIVPPAHAGR